MAVKIRLQRRGRSKRPFYHIVVADARAPRDGRFIEKLGVYNPMTKPATIELDQMRAYEWLSKGAQPTDTARAILRFKGVMKYKHLMRGVRKGALTQEQADAQWKTWMSEKDAKISARVAESAKQHAEWLAKLDGVVKTIKPKETSAPSESDDKSPKAVAEQEKTLAEIAAEKAPTGLEITEETPATEEETPVAEEPVATEEPESQEKEVVAEAEAPAEDSAPEEVAEPESEDEEPASGESTQEEVAEEASETPAEEPIAESAEAEKEPEATEESQQEEEVAATEKATSDDLTKIEGIGPKIAEALNNAGYNSFESVAGAEPEAIKKLLVEASPNLASHDPTTWPQQSALAAAGNWDELKSLQDQLDGGKETTGEGEEK